jgi:hypothetical protein
MKDEKLLYSDEEMSTLRTADFGSGGGILGPVTVRTPFSIAAFTSSTLVFSGSLKRLRKLP